MASFLSTFSIFLLVLFNGFFAIPVIVQQNSSLTFVDHLTTESQFNARLVPLDETSPLIDFEHQHAFDEHMDYNTSIPLNNSTEEHTGHGLRGFPEHLNPSPFAFTQKELTTTDAYDSSELFSSTLESTTDFDNHHKRYQDEQFSSTIEPVPSESTTEALTHILRSLNVNFDNDTDTQQGKRDVSVELITDSTLSSTSDPSDKMQQFATSKQSTVQVDVDHIKDSDEQQQQQHNQKAKLRSNHVHGQESETEVEPKHAVKPKPQSEVEPEAKPESEDEPEDELESKHAVKPKRKLEDESKPESKAEADSESGQHENEPHSHPHPEHEHNHKQKGVEKKQTGAFSSEEKTASTSGVTPTRKAQTPSYDDVQGDNSKETTAPTAYFDQDALQNVSYPFNNLFDLDDSNSLNVTDIPRRFSTSTMKNLEETKLNQGKKPLHVEEEESNH